MASKVNFPLFGGNSRVFCREYTEPGGAYGRNGPGNVWWVNSSIGVDTPGNGFSPESPFATLNYASAAATASNGDHVYLLPGHSESFASAGACSIGTAGLTIIGLEGNGKSRPTFNVITAATAGMVIGAAGCWFENVQYKCTGVSADTIPLSITGADCTLQNILFVTDDTTNAATCAIRTAATANNLTINQCDFLGSSTAAANTAIILVGGDGVKITNCQFQGTYSSGVGAVQNITTASTNLLFDNNKIANYTASNTKALVAVSGTTGLFTNNRVAILSGTAPLTAAGMCWAGGNSSVGAAGAAAGAF